MAGPPAVLIKRMQDGRHAVMSPDGSQLFGLHNSLQSANRQVQDYLAPGPDSQAAGQTPPVGPPAQGTPMPAGAAAPQPSPEAPTAMQAPGAQMPQVMLQATHPGVYQTPHAQAVAMMQQMIHAQNPLSTFASHPAQQAVPAQAPDGPQGQNLWNY